MKPCADCGELCAPEDIAKDNICHVCILKRVPVVKNESIRSDSARLIFFRCDRCRKILIKNRCEVCNDPKLAVDEIGDPNDENVKRADEIMTMLANEFSIYGDTLSDPVTAKRWLATYLQDIDDKHWLEAEVRRCEGGG